MRKAMSLSLASAAVLGFAAACTTAPVPPPAPAPGELRCVAEAGAWAVGKPVSDDLVAQVISDTHSKTARVIRPGQAVTMDFRGDRVNVMLDMNDKVDRVTCG
jgi:hypothetical protein